MELVDPWGEGPGDCSLPSQLQEKGAVSTVSPKAEEEGASWDSNRPSPWLPRNHPSSSSPQLKKMLCPQWQLRPVCLESCSMVDPGGYRRVVPAWPGLSLDGGKTYTVKIQAPLGAGTSEDLLPPAASRTFTEGWASLQRCAGAGGRAPPGQTAASGTSSSPSTQAHCPSAALFLSDSCVITLTSVRIRKEKLGLVLPLGGPDHFRMRPW